MTDKNWRSAKIPQWVKDSIEAELERNALESALRWPETQPPKPVDFQWISHFEMVGVPVEGIYYYPSGIDYITEISIRKAEETQGQHKKWKFSLNGSSWNYNNPVSIKLYRTQLDALHAMHHKISEESAKKLHRIIQKIKNAQSQIG